MNLAEKRGYFEHALKNKKDRPKSEANIITISTRTAIIQKERKAKLDTGLTLPQ
jgi:hypothetical protein